MTKIFKSSLLIFFVFMTCTISAQDSLCNCEEHTSIYDNKITTIDIYSADGKQLEHFYFNSLGDTTAWWKYFYNSEDVRIGIISPLASNKYEQRNILDSLGRVVTSIIASSGRIDTVDMSSYIVEYNENGDPKTDYLFGGSYAYLYDSLDRKIIEYYLLEEDDTSSFTTFEYDSLGNITKWAYYENDTLSQRDVSIYDQNGRFLCGTRTDGNGEILDIGCSDYDDNGFRYRSYGVHRYSGETKEWENLFKKIKCP